MENVQYLPNGKSDETQELNRKLRASLDATPEPAAAMWPSDEQRAALRDFRPEEIAETYRVRPGEPGDAVYYPAPPIELLDAAAELSSAGIDMPGVGVVDESGNNLPSAADLDRVAEERSAADETGTSLFVQFAAASRALARTRLAIRSRFQHDQVVCLECGAAAWPGSAITHEPGCVTSLVLSLADRLMVSSAFDRSGSELNPKRKEETFSVETRDAAGGNPPRLDFGEPWMFNAAELPVTLRIFDRTGRPLAIVPGSVGLEKERLEIAERIIAAINFASFNSTDFLHHVAAINRAGRSKV
jgi:hypothetical protein